MPPNAKKRAARDHQTAARLPVAAEGCLPERWLQRLGSLLSHLRVANHMRAQRPAPFRDRYGVCDYAAAPPLRNRSVPYLEFGVAKGNAQRHLIGLLHSLQTRLRGCDNFEGHVRTIVIDWYARFCLSSDPHTIARDRLLDAGYEIGRDRPSPHEHTGPLWATRGH